MIKPSLPPTPICWIFGLSDRALQLSLSPVFNLNIQLMSGLLLISSLSSVAQITPPKLTSDSQEFDAEKKQLRAEGRVELSHSDLFLETEQLTVEQLTFDVNAPGSLRITKGKSLILGEGMRYNYKDRSFALSNFRLGHQSIYAEGVRLEGEPGRIFFEDAELFLGEPDSYGPSVTAARITIIDESMVTAENAVLRIGGVPVFYLDEYTQSVQSGSPFRLRSELGYQKNLGAYAQSRAEYRRKPGYQYGLNLDLYSERGVMAGPVMTYSRFVDDGEYYTGTLDTGFIHDLGDRDDRGTDLLGAKIERFRFFNEWEHQQEIIGNIDLTGKLSWWSDSEALRDFREDHFDQNQQPDSFFEAVYRGEQYFLSGFARIQPNDYLYIGQRLPEVRLDVMPVEWFETGLYGRGSASFAQLIERDPSGVFGKRETGRFNVYYGMSRPTNLTPWLVVAPVAGAQLTHYTDPLSNRNHYTRLLGQIGLDLQATLFGAWDYNNAFWNINGLRHVLQPSIQYRYIPEAENGTNIIPKVDRLAAFESYLVPIDLGDKRNIDDLHESSTLRFGLENVLQTRHPEYGSIDLLAVDFFQDYRFSQRTGENDFSDFYTYIKAQPAYWLKLDSFSRVDPELLTLRELRNRLSVIDGEVWSVYVGNDYVKTTSFVDTYGMLTTLEEIHQYVVGARRRLNERNAVRGEIHVDTDLGEITEQIYAWQTRLGNSWDIEFQVIHRNGTTRKDDFQFKVMIDLLRF